MLSNRACKIKPSPTLAIDAKAKAMKAEGIDIVNFGVGEPDFDTPENIKEAAIKAIKDGFTKYTPVGGIDPLKDAIIEKFRKDNNLNYTRDEIIVSCGAKHSLYNIAQALFGPGDEILIPSPYWVSYPDQVVLNDAIPVFVKTYETDSFMVKTEAIASLGSNIKNKTIVVNGLSKAYAMTGWRIGYAAGPKEIIKAMTNIQSQSTSNPTSIAQKASVEALTGPQDFINTMLTEFDMRRRFLISELNSIPGMSCLTPTGAFYAFPNTSRIYGKSIDNRKISSSSDLALYLLEKAKVALVHGEAFGDDNYIRLSYATSIDEIKKGVERIREAVSRLS